MTERAQPATTIREPGTARRELRAAVGLCLAGALLTLVSAGRSWASAFVPETDLLPARAIALSGTDLAPGVTALALVGLAGMVALAATRRWGRIAVGVLIGLDGLGILAVTVDRLTGLTAAAGTSTAVREAGAAGGVTVDGTVWPYVALLGGVLLLAAGLLVAVRGPGWAALGRRYDAPTARPPLPQDRQLQDRQLQDRQPQDRQSEDRQSEDRLPEEPHPVGPSAPPAPPTERSLWEALDRGEDPTSR